MLHSELEPELVGVSVWYSQPPTIYGALRLRMAVYRPLGSDRRRRA